VIKKFMHLAIWSIFFFAGISETLGLPIRLLNFLALGLVMLLFVESFHRRKVKFPLVWIFLGLIGVTWVSGPLLQGTSPVTAFFFFRQLLLLQYLYMFTIVNEPDDKVIIFIKRVILALFFLQPIAAIIKIATIGIMESYIGTMSIREGSLTTVAVLVAFSYLFATYLYKRQRRQLVLMLFFVIFGLAGEKRAIFVFLPPILVSIFLFQTYVRRINFVTVLRTSGMLVLVGSALVYTIIRMNPTLNPDNRVWGEFDPLYTVDYVQRYSDRGTNLQDMSRIQSIKYLSGYITSQNPLVILFGEGAGKLSEASLDSDKNPIHYYYGIRYGGRMGIAWVFLQIGVLGVSLFMYFYFKMLRYVVRYCSDPITKVSFFGIWLSVALDIMIYSMVSIRFFVINGVLFFMFGMVFRNHTQKQHLEAKPELSNSYRLSQRYRRF
jgi:hypothetical protein